MKVIETFKNLMVEKGVATNENVDRIVNLMFFSTGAIPKEVGFSNPHDNAQFKFFWLTYFLQYLFSMHDDVELLEEDFDIGVEVFKTESKGYKVKTRILIGNLQIYTEEFDSFKVFTPDEFVVFLKENLSNMINNYKRFCWSFSYIFKETDNVKKTS
jgi:hypothetical protein